MRRTVSAPILAIALLAARGSAAQIQVHDGTNVLMLGDSLTAQGYFWSQQSQVGGTNLLVDQLSPVTVKQRFATVSGVPAKATGVLATVVPVALGGQINAINQGHGQKQIGDALANFSTWVAPFNPAVVVIEFGRNDVNPPLPPFIPTTLVSYRASYDAVIAQTQAAFPGVRIVCLSIFMDQEQWITVGGVPTWNNLFDPPPSNPTYTPSIVEFNVQTQQSCVNHGGTYIDLRAPALAVEAALNTPEPGSIVGPLTIDDTHPNAAGQSLISNAVRPAFVFQ